MSVGLMIGSGSELTIRNRQINKDPYEYEYAPMGTNTLYRKRLVAVFLVRFDVKLNFLVLNWWISVQANDRQRDGVWSPGRGRGQELYQEAHHGKSHEVLRIRTTFVRIWIRGPDPVPYPDPVIKKFFILNNKFFLFLKLSI